MTASVLLLACFVIHKYAEFMWILAFQWMMEVYRNNYLQDYRRRFSSCKPKEEWPAIAVPCYNESKKELCYMDWLIVNRLTHSFPMHQFSTPWKQP